MTNKCNCDQALEYRKLLQECKSTIGELPVIMEDELNQKFVRLHLKLKNILEENNNDS